MPRGMWCGGGCLAVSRGTTAEPEERTLCSLTQLDWRVGGFVPLFFCLHWVFIVPTGSLVEANGLGSPCHVGSPCPD